MRPLKLIMSAFGPYADATEVDFDALGTSGVYLVCGDTGSGKTMIFDALCFALFGQASGDVKGGARTSSSLRSDYARSDVRTFVELTFEYRKKVYRVKRNPEYERAKDRGEGTTRQKPDAELTFPDGRVVSGVSRVNEEIEALLGISVGQFKQIVMLAQGEFRRLLTADTATREGIFRKLFGTEVYASVQERLAKESQALERRRDRLASELAGIARSATFPEGGDREALFAEKSEAGYAGGSWLPEALEAQLGEDRPALEAIEEEMEALRGQVADAQKLLQKVERKPKLEQERKSLQAEIEGLEEGEAALRERLAEARSRAGELKALEDQAAVIEGSLPKYAEAEESIDAHAEASRRASEAAEVAENAKLAHEAIKTEMGDHAREVERLDGADVRLAEAFAALENAVRAREEAKNALDHALKLAEREFESERLHEEERCAEEAVSRASEQEKRARALLGERRAALDALGNPEADLARARAECNERRSAYDSAKKLRELREGLIREAESLKRPYERAVEELKAREAVHDRNQEHANDVGKRQRAGRAGLLAGELEAGKPCPVCGSTSHPHPAHGFDEVPSDAELDEANDALRESAQKLSDAAEAAAKAKMKLDGATKRLEDFDDDHGASVGVERAVEEARTNFEQALQGERAAEASCAEAKRAKDALSLAQKEHERAADTLEKASAALARARVAASSSDSAIEALRGQLGPVSVEAAENAFLKADAAHAKASDAHVRAKVDNDQLAAKSSDLEKARRAEARAGRESDEALENLRAAKENERVLAERMGQLKADLKFADRSAAQEKAFELRKDAQVLRDAMAAAEKAVTENQHAQDTDSRLLESIVAELGAIPDASPEKVEEELAAHNAKLAELKPRRTSLDARIRQNERCLAQLRDELEKAGDLEERAGRVAQLSQVANGTLAKGSKIQFEAYVQAIYFDRVIEAANHRLRFLTNGQFTLVRNSEGGGRSKAGLRLFVHDAATGRFRDASSLSGGESFQASLCLALGLSDIVQAHAGGIEFDTMFVDEGFGSLDQGALGNAISLLSGLSDGSKLIGIISHVEDLKANIPKKLIVTKGRDGSSVKLDV